MSLGLSIANRFVVDMLARGELAAAMKSDPGRRGALAAVLAIAIDKAVERRTEALRRYVDWWARIAHEEHQRSGEMAADWRNCRETLCESLAGSLKDLEAHADKLLEAPAPEKAGNIEGEDRQ